MSVSSLAGHPVHLDSKKLLVRRKRWKILDCNVQMSAILLERDYFGLFKVDFPSSSPVAAQHRHTCVGLCYLADYWQMLRFCLLLLSVKICTSGYCLFFYFHAGIYCN